MAFIGTPLDTRNTFQSLQGKRFNADGSTTAFTLDVAPGSVLDIEVFDANERQDPNSAYTLSGTTLTVTGAPPSGTNNIYVVHQAKSVGTIDVPALGVTTASIQADAITEAKIADDAVESEHLNNNIISGQTALGATPADTDEFLVSDAGTIKRVDYSYIKGELNSPAFNVFQSSSASISNASYTVLSLDGNTYNPDSKFASNKFTPAVSGLYYLEAKIRYNTTSTFTALQVVIRKNGSALVRGTNNNTNYSTATVSALIQSDTDDYFDVEAYQNSGGSLDLINNAESTYFLGFRVIST